jgi:hypothetical protein
MTWQKEIPADPDKDWLAYPASGYQDRILYYTKFKNIEDKTTIVIDQWTENKTTLKIFVTDAFLPRLSTLFDITFLRSDDDRSFQYSITNRNGIKFEISSYFDVYTTIIVENGDIERFLTTLKDEQILPEDIYSCLLELSRQKVSTIIDSLPDTDDGIDLPEFSPRFLSRGEIFSGIPESFASALPVSTLDDLLTFQSVSVSRTTSFPT